ncbi:MAG: DNA repair protein RecN [Proteobacteria bacterium]|nr:DNA repair protein RecN [Pseudomonadota bacterium]
MLRLLRIQNFITVEELEIEFGKGLNVMTGETGSGKSVILKSVELLTGKRATNEFIRSGCSSCTIEGLFEIKKELNNSSELPEELQEIFSEDEILVKRIIDQSGKSKIYLNGSLITATTLQNLSPLLIDITSQHQQQSLLNPKYHLSLLDSYGIDSELLTQVSTAFQSFSHAKRRLENFQKNSSEQQQYLDRIYAEKAELSILDLKLGVRAEAEQELNKLAHVETLTSNINRCVELIEGADSSDSRGSLDTQIRTLSSIIEQSANLDNELNSVADLVESASAQINEIKILLSEYGSSLEIDPDRIEQLREKIAEIARVERKYNKDEAALIAYLAKINNEITEIESGSFNSKQLEEDFKIAEKELKSLERTLTAERIKLAKSLSTEVKSGLAQLKMKEAIFEVQITPGSSTATGADNVEFLLSTNPGESLKSLNKIASGGELSRILLVLKTALNEKNAALTQIFDEVDTGIGGAVSQIVGEKLSLVAKNNQVIIITHSPQVAAFADEHFLISKAIKNNKARTSVTLLNKEEKVNQIATMLAGKKVTKEFHDSAGELIKSAGKV